MAQKYVKILKKSMLFLIFINLQPVIRTIYSIKKTAQKAVFLNIYVCFGIND